MSKLYILHENNDWLPSIREELEKHNIPFEEWYLVEDGLIDLTVAPPEGVFWNRVSPSAHTRGHQHSSSFAFALLNWLESHGRTVINGSKSLSMEVSKVAQYNALTQMGIKSPASIAVFSRPDFITAANKIGFPLITKHNCGGRGSGVRVFEDMDSLKKHLDSTEYEESTDGISLVQQYIKSAENYITRMEFIDKQFIYAVRINNEQGFNLCPADSCSLDGAFCATSAPSSKFNIMKDFSHPIIEAYQDFLHKHKIDIAGIEFIIDNNGESYSYDINTNTNYNSKAEDIAGISAHEALAVFIKNKLESL